MDQMWIPINHSWRLNERHYGALQGLNKAETLAKYGEEQFLIWRRSYDIQPPALTYDDDRYPGLDPRYKDLIKQEKKSLQNYEEHFFLFLQKIYQRICIQQKIQVLTNSNQ